MTGLSKRFLTASGRKPNDFGNNEGIRKYKSLSRTSLGIDQTSRSTHIGLIVDSLALKAYS